MKYHVVLRAEAENDIDEAYRWYEKQIKGLGFDFILSVDAAISSIERSPHFYSKIHKNIRRALIRRFPFGIFFIIKGKKIIIIAIFHVKRDPIRWQKRN